MSIKDAMCSSNFQAKWDKSTSLFHLIPIAKNLKVEYQHRRNDVAFGETMENHFNYIDNFCLFIMSHFRMLTVMHWEGRAVIASMWKNMKSKRSGY